MNPSYVAIGALVLTLLGVLWRTSALTTRLELTIDSLAKEVEALKAERKALHVIPGLEQRVAQLEEVTTEIMKTLRGSGQDSGLLGRIRIIEKKFSGEHAAVRLAPERDPRTE